MCMWSCESVHTIYYSQYLVFSLSPVLHPWVTELHLLTTLATSLYWSHTRTFVLINFVKANSSHKLMTNTVWNFEVIWKVYAECGNRQSSESYEVQMWQKHFKKFKKLQTTNQHSTYKITVSYATKSQSHMPQNHSLICHKITVSHATTDNDNSVALNLLMALII